MNINTKIRKLQTVDLHMIINDAARAKQEDVILLNQDQMWKSGIMDTDKPNKQLDYAASTIAQKKKRATFKKTNFITLRWFGDFYDSIKLLFFKNRFVIQSDDLKWANWLEPQDRFTNALGLTDKSMDKLRRILKPGIIMRLKKAI